MKLEDAMSSLDIAVKAKFPNLDIQDNTVEKEVFLRAPALLVDSEDRVQQYITRTSTPSAFLDLYSDESFLSNDLPVIFGVPNREQALAILSTQVDVFAGNYGILRTVGGTAKGFVTIVFGSAGAVVVSAGTVFKTRGAISLRYYCVRTFSGTPTLVDGVYQITVPVESADVGVDFNISANNVVVLEGSITGFVSVTNSADITGGVNVESDTALLERVISSFRGSSIDSVEGVRKVVLDAGAFDAQVFRVGDPVTRNRPGPDVLVVSENVGLQTDVFTFEPSHAAGYVPLVQPLGYDPSQMSIVGRPSCQFLLISDSSVNERSERAQDRVIFYGTDIPLVGEVVQFSYPANSEIAAYQALYAPPNPQLFFDVLVKTAMRTDIALSLNVVLFGGVDPTAITPTIQSEVLNLVNSLKMGVELSQSDIIGVVENISGVNRVNLPMNFFGLAGESGRVVENAISPDLAHYLRLSSSNFTLTVV